MIFVKSKIDKLNSLCISNGKRWLNNLNTTISSNYTEMANAIKNNYFTTPYIDDIKIVNGIFDIFLKYNSITLPKAKKELKELFTTKGWPVNYAVDIHGETNQINILSDEYINIVNVYFNIGISFNTLNKHAKLILDPYIGNNYSHLTFFLPSINFIHDAYRWFDRKVIAFNDKYWNYFSPPNFPGDSADTILRSMKEINVGGFEVINTDGAIKTIKEEGKQIKAFNIAEYVFKPHPGWDCNFQELIIDNI